MPRILVVDADAGVRDRLTTVLLDDGYEAEAVSGLADALRCLDRAPSDLVISDCAEGGGLRLLAKVRERFPELPVVMMADGDPEQWEDVLRTALLRGASDTLLKPLDEGRVRAAVTRLLAEEGWVPFGECA